MRDLPCEAPVRLQQSPVRITFVAPFAVSPKATISARMLPIAAELVAIGHDVTILVPPYDNPKDSGRTWRQDGVLIENMRRGAMPDFLLQVSLALRLAGRVRQLNPDVLHIFKPVGPGALALDVLTSHKSSKYMLVVDTDDWEGRGGWADVNPYPWFQKLFMSWQEGHVLSKADHITCASYALVDRTRLMTSGRVPCALIPNGPLASWRAEGMAGRELRTATRARLNWTPHTVFVYAGTVSRNHDLDIALEGFAAVIKGAQTSAKLVMIVTGDGVVDLRRRVAALGLSEYVEWSSFMEHRLLVEMLCAADVGIFPYRDTNINRAKCSGKVMDYMNAGLPVLATDVGMMGQYVANGLTGLLAPLDDNGAFAENMLSMVDQPGVRRHMGLAGLERIWTEFAWSKNIGQLESIYMA